jgi:hypothetical protein
MKGPTDQQIIDALKSAADKAAQVTGIAALADWLRANGPAVGKAILDNGGQSAMRQDMDDLAGRYPRSKLASSQQGQSNTASPNPNNNDPQDRNRTEKSIRSLQGQVSKHEQKLADYKRNPDKYDNKGLLRNAPPEARQRIIQGRVRKLEREIKTFKREINKLRENQ